VNSNWEHFLEAQPWVIRDGATVEVGPRTSASPSPVPPQFPRLARLLGAAQVTLVTIDGTDHELLTWSTPASGDRRHWLCPLGTDMPDIAVYPGHRALLRAFGGVCERSIDEPDTWLMNCDDALTSHVATQTAAFLADFDWVVEDRSGGWPINLDAYYSICQEANGNTTFCHRVTGDVILFAPDHAFDHVEVLEGCPPYSLYLIPTAATFVDWVEEVARQWLIVCGLPT
jgi:hypothetical protein